MHALLTHLVVEIEQMVALGKFALVRGSEDNCLVGPAARESS